MLRRLALTLAGLIVLASPAAAQAVRVPTIQQAHQAIHRADPYAFVGRCHRTRYSVVCKVAHEYEACEEDGACATGKIKMGDRVHWHRGHTVVSVLWTTVTV